MHNGDAWVAWFLSGGTTLHLAARNLVYENNIQTVGNYKVFGSGKGSNLPSLNWYVSSWSWSRNVMVLRSMDADHSGDVGSFSSSSPYESNGTNYPSGSYGPNGAGGVGFVNPGPDTVTDRGLYLNAYDFRLTANSPYHNAGTDAKDIGPDWDVLNAATTSARNGGAAGGTAPAAPAKLRIATY
jgi:hypothetical protein